MGEIADYYVNQMIFDDGMRQAERDGLIPLPNPIVVGNRLQVSGARPYRSNVPKDERKLSNYRELVNMGEIITKYVAVVQYLQPTGSFGGTSKQYDFLCNIPLQENDIVVVDSVNGLGLAKVVGVKKTSSAANKWVVGRVDLAEHEERLRKEEKRKELEKAMEARAKQVDKMARYKQMAKDDPEMARLLAELEGLDSTQLTEGTKTQGQIHSGEPTDY